MLEAESRDEERPWEFLGVSSGYRCKFVRTPMPLNFFNRTYTQRYWKILSIIRTVFGEK